MVILGLSFLQFARVGLAVSVLHSFKVEGWSFTSLHPVERGGGREGGKLVAQSLLLFL